MQNKILKKIVNSRIIRVAVVLTVVGLFIYSKHLQIATMIWHWKHGDYAHVGRYEVFVPQDWLLQVDDKDLVSMIHVRPSQPAKHSVIMMFTTAPPAGNLDFWMSIKKQSLKERGIAIEERSFKFDSETLACLGGQQEVPIPNTVSLECRSSGNFNLMFIGQREDLQFLYYIVPKIRRIS